MRVRLLVCSILATSMLGAVVAATGASGAQDAKHYVVLYEQGASAAKARAAITSAGGKVTGENRKIGLAEVTSSDSGFERDVTRSAAVSGAASDRAIGEVPAAKPRDPFAIERTNSAFARRNFSAKRRAGRPTDPPADPLTDLQWDMRAINAGPRSYRRNPGNPGVRVGVIDTGVDGTHPDIAPNFNRSLSRNFTTDDPVIDGACDTDPDKSCTDPNNVDEDGHGTHVAGTIASPINRQGITGVAPGVELINIRAGQDSGYFFLKPTVDALTYAGDIGVDVVNMSYYVDPWLFNCASNPADSPAEQQEQRTVIAATQRALNYARNRGVTLVSAEGNGNSDLGKPTEDLTSPDYPDQDLSPHPRQIDNSCISEPTEGKGVIGVTSVGKSGRKAYYSDYGTEQADIAAPGGDKRDFFGTDEYLNPANTVLAPYPKNVADAEGTLNPDGTPNTPSVVEDTSAGTPAYYQYLQGTSMASPHAAGVAALIVAARGKRDRRNGGLTLSPDKVEKVLYRTAQKRACPTPRRFTYPDPDLGPEYTAVCEGPKGDNGFFGHGVVDALAAGAKAGR